MKIPKYPEDFYDFSNGYDVSDDVINKWIEQCVEHLESNLHDSNYSVSSGNTSVQVYRSSVCEYEVFVSKSHATAEIYLKE